MTAALAIAALVGWIVLVSLAGASWKAIVAADAAYAKELFTPPVDQVFYRLGPVNAWALFRHRPPAAAATRVYCLRGVLVIQACVVMGFCASLIWA